MRLLFTTVGKMRLAKFLAVKNVCSRRDAEKHIVQGNVVVNGQVINSPVFFVDDNDVVSFCGKYVNKEIQPKLWMYYKPNGEITSHNDPQKRKTVFESVKQKGLPRVVSIGRLDINSEGLILLTNSSTLAHELETTHLQRVYKVRAFGVIDDKKLSKYAEISDDMSEIILKNIVISGIRYMPIRISIEAKQAQPSISHNFWLTVAITEGKNREIRKIMNFIGLQVNRLIRIQYGPYAIGDMRPGEINECLKSFAKNNKLCSG
ncbi:MAG: rRNA pseudouridine synthase [Holosporales bacterium]|nr:rRNA pseudouridine synthase [Holosporales bacterium]